MTSTSWASVRSLTTHGTWISSAASAASLRLHPATTRCLPSWGVTMMGCSSPWVRMSSTSSLNPASSMYSRMITTDGSSWSSGRSTVCMGFLLEVKVGGLVAALHEDLGCDDETVCCDVDDHGRYARLPPPSHDRHGD